MAAAGFGVNSDDWPTNEQLNKLFESKVRPGKDQTNEIMKSLMPDLEKIFKYIHDKDNRFAGVLSVGSYYQGLKIIRSDEFDFTLFLDFDRFEHPTPRWMRASPPGTMAICHVLSSFLSQLSARPGVNVQVPGTNNHYGFRGFDDNDFWANAHVSPQLVSDRDDKLTKTNLHITVDSSYKIVYKSTRLPPPSYGYHTLILQNSNEVERSLLEPPLSYMNSGWEAHLIPFSVKVRLKELIDEAVNSSRFEGEFTFQPRAHGPALTVKYNHPSDDISFSTSVDITAALRGKTLEELGIQWPVSQQWPPSALVQDIKKTNVMYVAKRNFYWRISFAECEKKLSKFCQRGVSDSCRKKVHRIMKFWHKKFWCPHAKPEISSYILKNVWMHEMERYPSDEDWRECKLNDRLYECIVHLIEYVIWYIFDKQLGNEIRTTYIMEEMVKQIVDEIAESVCSYEVELFKPARRLDIISAWVKNSIVRLVLPSLTEAPRVLRHYFDRDDNLLKDKDEKSLKKEVARIILHLSRINECI